MPDIGEYGFLSDCQSAALVSRHGSVDWWCVPRFDSPSVFGRLLGPDAGHWSLHPAAPHQVHRAYLPDSLVLRTVFSTGDGEVAVTDALATEPGARGHQLGLRSPHVLIRTVEGLRGSVELVTDFAPRMEYGLTVPHLALRPDGVQARGGPVTLTLTTPVRLDYDPDREPGRELLVALADRAAATWEDPDAGMWEARDRHRHYLSSKLMCWVALDRAVALAPRLGPGAKPESWAQTRERIRAEILAQGWNDQAKAYTGAFGSAELDASVLLMPIVGFLPATDDRMWATIEAIERELGASGLVRRWRDDPMGFGICTYWLVEGLALGGAVDRAREWFGRAGRYANDLGLLAEGGDPATGARRGNYPQAFSHVGLITAAWRLGQCS